MTGGMKSFPEDRNLQHVGCAAVANLAIGNQPNAGRLVKAGAASAVRKALDLFVEVRVCWGCLVLVGGGGGGLLFVAVVVL